MIEEKWKEIPDFNKYEVSTLGKVRRIGSEHNKKLTLNKGGYLVVCLYNDNKRYVKLVHRLVLETFTGFSKLHVNHINEHKQDNRLSNLEYMTQSDNNNYGTRNIRISKAHSIPIKCVELNQTFKSTKEASETLNIPTSNICNVLKGVRKQAGGYTFEYSE